MENKKKSFLKGTLALILLTGPVVLEEGFITEELNFLSPVGFKSRNKGEKSSKHMKVYRPEITLEDQSKVGHEELDFRLLQDISKRFLKDGDSVTVKLDENGEDLSINEFKKVFVRKWQEREILPSHLLPISKVLRGNYRAMQVVKDLTSYGMVIMTPETLEKELADYGKAQRKADENQLAKHEKLTPISQHVETFLSKKEYIKTDEPNLEPKLENTDGNSNSDEGVEEIIYTDSSPEAPVLVEREGEEVNS